MDITIKIDLTENTIKALHGVVAAITTPKGVRVSLTALADAASHLQKGPVSDWAPQDTRYTDNVEPVTDTPAAPDAVEETPKPVEPAKAEPAKKPAAKKAAPKKTEETPKPVEPGKEEPKAEEPAKAEAPKKAEAKAPTKDDVTKALTKLMEAKGGDKTEAMALVKSNSSNGKLSGVDPAKYADIIAEAEAAING